jgi:hypothetical protein
MCIPSRAATAQKLSFSTAALAYLRADGEARFLAPLLKHFGETPLEDITQDKIDAAAAFIYPEATAATRNSQLYSPLSAVMKQAGVERVIRRPKWAGVPVLGSIGCALSKRSLCWPPPTRCTRGSAPW